MLRNEYLNFFLLNALFVSIFIVFNDLFLHIDVVVIIFLIFTSTHGKISVYHVIVSGVLYDFIYPKFVGIGVLLFFALFCLNNLFNWIWDISSVKVRFLYFALSILVYKIFGLFVFRSNFSEDFSTFFISYMFTLILIYVLDFIFGSNRCFSDT